MVVVSTGCATVVDHAFNFMPRRSQWVDFDNKKIHKPFWQVQGATKAWMGGIHQILQLWKQAFYTFSTFDILALLNGPFLAKKCLTKGSFFGWKGLRFEPLEMDKKHTVLSGRGYCFLFFFHGKWRRHNISYPYVTVYKSELDLVHKIDLSVNLLPMGYWFHVIEKKVQEFENTRRNKGVVWVIFQPKFNWCPCISMGNREQNAPTKHQRQLNV